MLVCLWMGGFGLVVPKIEVDGKGNLTYVSSWGLGSVVKSISFDLVLMRYLMTCLTCVKCPGDGLDVYLARMFVMVLMSRRVDMESHVKHPSRTCMKCWSLCWMCVDAGIVSTGWPLL